MKTVLKLLIILSLTLGISYTLNVNAATGTVSVITSEIVPGANCQTIPVDPMDPTKGIIPDRYKCQVGKGFGPITAMIGKMIKYFTFIAGLGGVLFIVINGILYSMGGMDPTMKDEAKKRITATLLGLVLLLISGIVLRLIAPWVFA